MIWSIQYAWNLLDPRQFQFYLPESKYLFRSVELEKRFFIETTFHFEDFCYNHWLDAAQILFENLQSEKLSEGKTVVRLMAYQNFAIEVGNLPDDALRVLLEELLSKLAKSKIKVHEFSKPTWACDQLFGGSYPNNPGIWLRIILLSADYLHIRIWIYF